MSDYATIQDVQNLKRQLTASEQTRASALIPIICDLIRYEAKRVGKDFDKMIYMSELCPVVDEFTGNGATTSFTLSRKPANVVSVRTSEGFIDAYTVSGDRVIFDTAPEGEILILSEYRALAEVAKAVVCDVVMRELNTPATQLPATSFSEGAGSVSQSFTLPNASGAIKLWNSDKKALGLLRQQIGTISLWNDTRKGAR